MKKIMKFHSLAIAVGIAVLVAACGGSDKKKTPPPKSNTSPTAMSASLSTQADTELKGTLMGSDRDNDMLTYTVGTQPTNGNLTVKTDGSFTYMPKADMTGSDQFTFIVSDGKSTSQAATVNITIDLLAVNMSDYTRKAFNQMQDDTPVSLNTRVITQDVTDTTAFDDLLMQ